MSPNFSGSEGEVVRLIANHFRVISHHQHSAFKYNVDYTPDVEAGNLRQILLNQHIRKFGECHIFDGNSLLLPRPLRERKVEWVSTTEDKKIVKIVVEFSKELAPTSPDCLRFYNILFRKTFKELNLKQIGRHYYTEKIPLTLERRGTSLEIWRGYVTSILQYENSITLCADVNHKLLRIETVYDFISKIQAEAHQGNPEVEVANKLIGSIVLTKYNTILYNNRTYRVDGVDWNLNPRHTFNKSDGTKITYIDYYKQKRASVDQGEEDNGQRHEVWTEIQVARVNSLYVGITEQNRDEELRERPCRKSIMNRSQHKEIITVMKQPLLVSQGRWKKGQTGTQRQPILLIPQLCYMTGIGNSQPLFNVSYNYDFVQAFGELEEVRWGRMKSKGSKDLYAYESKKQDFRVSGKVLRHLNAADKRPPTLE
ncbi:Piwi-like protein 3 [Saguinus oedipus]|uniref:Piwi-like protein 3 n=1 Tax=Saguinus oedipus TaxID=9490 RepID=A0ABQ9WHZ4_SAGOE|nr:Piwi-like protein 3 [Saguinus oedipus]